MTPASYRTPAAEMAAIHAAVCRSKKQGLVCGTCCEHSNAGASPDCVGPLQVAERAERVAAHQSEAA